jgi:predicted transcriptional regulator of viral defense system
MPYAPNTKCAMHMNSQNFSTNSLSKGEILEKYIADNLPRFFPNYKLIDKNKRFADYNFDIHAKGPNGTDYFFEVKASKCNRLSIGQVVEAKARLSKVYPNAKVILICEGIKPELKETLKKINIEVETLADLGINPNDITNNQVEKAVEIKLSPVEQNAYFALLRRGKIMASAEDLQSSLNVSYVWAKNILSKLASHGAAQRIGKGKYAIVPADVLYRRKSYVADPLVLVSELMKGVDYYVAYLSAAHFHGLTEQIPFKTIVAVPKQLRSINVGNIRICFVKLKKSRFFGYSNVRYSDTFLNVSDLEKTIVDCVNRQDLCGGAAEVIRIIANATETKRIYWHKIGLHVEKYESHALAQRMGFIIELLAERKKIQVDQELINDLTLLTGSKIYPLDLKAPKEGKLSKKWGIINNAGQLEI